MLIRLILLFAFSFLIAFSTKADTFIVTSNADSGPGTLREALSLAAGNGNTVKDYIYFNLPDVSEAGRTITLTSDLPQVSANVVIDASTQPGQKLGVSDAKVTIKPQPGESVAFAFVTQETFDVPNNTVELYGLYITGFNQFGNGGAVRVNAGCKFTLGAPGKGNLINNCGYVLIGNFTNGTIQSNIIGLDKDGETIASNAYVLNTANFNNLLIGGDDPQQGNVISGNSENIFLYGASNAGRAFIRNNFFGTNYTATKTLNYYGTFDGYIKVQGYQASATIEKNTFSADQTAVTLINSSSAIVKGNFMGTDRTQTHSLGHNNNEAVNLLDFCYMLFGGETEVEQNVVTNYNVPVFVDNVSHCEIIKNHFYCNGYIIIGGSLSDQLVNITKLTNNYAYGNAPAGARVQLYHSEEGCSTCNPKQWFADAYADNNGHWQYSGPISGKLIVSGTVGNSTIAFAPTYMKQREVEIKPVNCSNVGSIEIIEKREGRFQFIWKNEAGEVIGTDQKVNVSTSGRYTLEINEDGTCPVSLGYFDVGQYAINAYGGGDQLNCNKPTGTLYANYSAYPSDNIQFKWEDKNGVLPATGSTLSGLPAGDYYLTVYNAEGCKSERVLYQVLPAASQPTVDITAIDRQPAYCGLSNGSIKNIKVTGNVLYYSWQDSQGNEVGNTLDLTNQPSGSYTLLLTYDYNCPPLPIQSLEIEAASAVTINIDAKIVTKASCNNTDGAIKGITVTGDGTLTYKWENEIGQVFPGDIDLLNVPPGKYKLKVNNGICPEVSSEFIEVLSDDINLIINPNGIRSATECQNGSITLLQAPGATSYEWRRKADQSYIINTLDLPDAPAGDYDLILSNGTCSRTYHLSIAKLDKVVFPPFPAQSIKSCGDFPSGKVVINTDGAPSQPIAFRLVNEQGDTKGYDKTVEYLSPGKYKLYVTDYTGCESFNSEYTVEAYPPFGLIKAGSYNPIFCGVGTTNITETIITGGSGVYTYTWTKNDVEIPGEHDPYLNNIGAGKYKLVITDNQGCLYLPFPFDIKDEVTVPPAPLVSDKEVNRKGNTTLTVQDAYPTAIYNLYNSETATTRIDQSIGGNFTVNITETKTYWVTLTYGTCESTRSKATIVLGLITNDIPNAFSPNGDGVNDYWAINGIEQSTLSNVKVFNRQGQTVFQSRGYAKPFDGTYMGKQLPAGVYYYIIERQNDKPLSGHVTIIR